MMIFFSLCTLMVLLFSGISHAVPQFGILPSTTATEVAASTTLASAAGTVACNNSPELCNRNYNNITHIGAHDSFALRDNTTGFSASGNQFYNATLALSAGIRVLQVQAHVESSVIRLCHSSCSLLDGGTLESFLGSVKSWMDSNLNEVVTLVVVNSDRAPAASFGQAFSSSGISSYGYTPASATRPIANWPTLQTLITANTRLITFIASIDYDSTLPYLLPEFEFVFETAFGVTEFTAFTCELDRPTSLSSSAVAVSEGYMGLLNHFKAQKQAFFDVPDEANITTTNSASTTIIGAAGLHGLTCANEWKVKPTFILVDFWNVGPSIATGDLLNGIVGVGRTDISSSVLTASESLGVRTKGTVGLGTMAGLAMGAITLCSFIWL